MPRVLCIILLFAFLLTHCSSGRKAEPSGEERSAVAEAGKVIADAYLFDCKLKRDGKTNSFRLEVLVTDTVAGFAGRGYLGKGILQGILRRDSLFAAFPTAREYLAEDIKSLLRLGECIPEFSDTVILGLLQPIWKFPLEELNENIDVDEFTLYPIGDSCSIKLSFSYKKRNKIWRPDKIEFFDGKQTKLTAKCREVKVGAKIAANRFQFTPPEQAVRIFP